jgi:hypothetical protein
MFLSVFVQFQGKWGSFFRRRLRKRTLIFEVEKGRGNGIIEGVSYELIWEALRRKRNGGKTITRRRAFYSR